MAKKQYAYYVRGRELAIVEADVSAIPDGSITPDPEWGSPNSSETDAILLEYIAIPKAKDGGEIQDESDEIDISDLFARALVSYLKARFAEDNGDMKLREYYLRDFYRILDKGDNNKITTVRRTQGSM